MMASSLLNPKAVSYSTQPNFTTSNPVWPLVSFELGDATCFAIKFVGPNLAHDERPSTPLNRIQLIAVALKKATLFSQIAKRTQFLNLNLLFI
jgi:hypothetical protein